MFAVETWDGGRYVVESCHDSREEAQRRADLLAWGCVGWHNQPRVREGK